MRRILPFPPCIIRIIAASIVQIIFLNLALAANFDDHASIINLAGVPPGYAFERFCKLNSGELWVVGGDGQIVVHSADGKIREQRPIDVDLNGVYFSTSDIGWVVGVEGTVLHTTDGGGHWIRQRSGIGDDLRAITCTDESHCWIVGASNFVLRTADGGQRWEKKKLLTSGGFYAVDFVNHLTGWVSGADGLLMKTQDGGDTWTENRVKIIVNPESSFAGPSHLIALKFINERLGWVAGWGGIARTLDGGQSWRVTRIDEPFIGLATSDEQSLWAVSKDGNNYCSTDAGESWKRCSSP